MSKFQIGLFYPNAAVIHTSSRLARELNLDVTSAASHVAVAQAAERAGLDYMFLADQWGGYGPATRSLGYADPMLFAPMLGALLIGATGRIEVITTMHHSWLQPLHIARMGANLAVLSGGRWGMNSVSGAGFAPELLRSTGPVLEHDQLYAAASESMEIIQQAWNDDGEVDFEGQYYRAKGRIIGPMPGPDQQPKIVSAGASDEGCAYAGRYASLVFVPGRMDPDGIARRRAKVETAAAEAGRSGADIKVLIHASVLIGETAAEAEELSGRLREAIDVQALAEYLSGVTSQVTTYDDMYGKYSQDQLEELALTGGSVKIHGDAEQVASGLRELRDQSGCDGISLSMPIWQPEMIERFGTDVAPLLEEMGMWSPSVIAGVQR